MSNAALDKKILLPTIAIVLLTSAPLIFYASSLQGMIQSIYDFTAKSFGWGYILLYLLGGFFVFFIAFSPTARSSSAGMTKSPFSTISIGEA
jgi:BCCT family betaine/carnitine transporter